MSEAKFKIGDTVQDTTNNHILTIGNSSISPDNSRVEYYLLTDGPDGGYWVSEEDVRSPAGTDHTFIRASEVFWGTTPAKSISSDGSDTGSALTSKHYNSKLIQPIEISQMVLTHEEFIGAMKFNIMKYTQRAGSKEGESSTKDWNKALQYKLWLEMAERGETIDPRKDVV